MPYAEPTSPLPSPVKETTAARKGWLTPPSHIEDTSNASSSSSTGPMLGIPRRSGNSTPRRNSPSLARASSSTTSFITSRPMEGLPRRMSNPVAPLVPGLPVEGGSLGLKLLPSPTKPAAAASTSRQPLRPVKDSMSSISTVDSSLPPTPADEPISLPPLAASSDVDATPKPITIGPYAPPPRGAVPGRSALSPRPTLNNTGRRRSGSPGSTLAPYRMHAHSSSLQIDIASSSSAAQLTAPSSSDSLSPMPRPASMIRKKSGEVVKPSLKQRSMSTPDLSRQADAYPSTPEGEDERGFPEERSKSVRFAGADEADGGTLENVVLFLREQKPAAVGKAADPERAYLTETETEAEADTDGGSDFVQFRTRRNAAAHAADSDRLVMDGGSKVPRVRLDFSPDSQAALKNEFVVLERAELLHDQGPLQLKGTAVVRNMSFQKWVAIRFTMDHWQTVSEVSGQHVTHIPSETTGDEGWDRFSFSIKLEDYRRKLEERQLMLCIRFSVDGQEWWDSNNGLNYVFTFKKATPRRSRMSGPATLGAGFRIPTEVQTAIPLRANRVASPAAAQIKKAFGTESKDPRQWTFPRLAAQIHAAPPPRPESPASRPPPESFMAPKLPDVMSHLSLSKRYCAPSPPTSPPRLEGNGGLPTLPPLVLSAESEQMGVLAGGFATLSPPVADRPGHERRSSWNGDQTDGWHSFTSVMTEETTPTDGEMTPVAIGSRSPRILDSSSDSSPERRPLSMKRSTGDLRALLTDDSGLMTPSSSSSSPTSPSIGLPVIPMSPSDDSMTSTGESSPLLSSPVNAVINNDSAADLANLAISIDPEERGRPLPPKMLSNSYQEFLDKFCFFQSPRMTPNEEPVFSRPTYANLSGQASPNGFPFNFSSNTSSSPRSTPTPTNQYDSANDAFATAYAQEALNASPSPTPGNVPSPLGPRKGETGIISGPGALQQGSGVTPKGSPLPGTPPVGVPLGQYALGNPIPDKWAMPMHQLPHQQGSPQLAAAAQ